MNCFHFGGRAFHSRSLPPTQQSFAMLQKSSAGERHTKKANLLQRSRHPIRVPSTPALAHAPPTRKAHRAPTHTSALFTFLLARNARAYTSARSIGLEANAIWVCISSSSSLTPTPYHTDQSAEFELFQIR
jgi:hypothetical protein